MNIRIHRFVLILASFIFLNGFIPFIALLGPGLTMFTSGNIYKAGAQFVIDRHVKSKTGKSSLSYIKDNYFDEEITVQKTKKHLDADLKKLVEQRVKTVHKKLAKQNKENNLNKDLRNLLKKRVFMAKRIEY